PNGRFGSCTRQDIGLRLEQPLSDCLLLGHFPLFVTNFQQRLLQAAEGQFDSAPCRALLAPDRLVLREWRLAEAADLQCPPARYGEPFDLALAGIHLYFARQRRYDIIFVPDESGHLASGHDRLHAVLVAQRAGYED